MDLAMERAISGGYKNLIEHDEKGSQYENRALLDPTWWQCLGKAEGWGEKGSIEAIVGTNPSWRDNWHSLIDHLADGKDIDSFFKSLLKDK